MEAVTARISEKKTEAVMVSIGKENRSSHGQREREREKWGEGCLFSHVIW